MKKVFTIIFTAVLFISCSNDDSKDNENLLIGTWILQESYLNGREVESQNIVEFTSDNKTEFVYYDYDITETRDITETGTWNKTNNTLTITWNESNPGLETYVLEIQELTETTLKWETNIENEGTLNEILLRQ